MDSLAGQQGLTPESCSEEPASFGAHSDSGNPATQACLLSSTCENVLKDLGRVGSLARPPKSPKRSWAASIKAEGPEGGRGLLGQTASGMPDPVLRDG